MQTTSVSIAYQNVVLIRKGVRQRTENQDMRTRNYLQVYPHKIQHCYFSCLADEEGRRGEKLVRRAMKTCGHKNQSHDRPPHQLPCTRPFLGSLVVFPLDDSPGPFSTLYWEEEVKESDVAHSLPIPPKLAGMETL